MGGRGGFVGAGARAYIVRLIADAVAAGGPICLDSTALIAYLRAEEPIASLIEPVLLAPDLDVVVSTITLAEIGVRAAGLGGRPRVEAVQASILELPLMRPVDFDQVHAVETAVVRAEPGLKLPDAAIVATARLAGVSALIGNDRQWRNKPLGVPYHHLDDLLAHP